MVDSGSPSQPPIWQTVVTIGLIVHGFCVGIAVLSNVGGQASPLGRALRSIPLVTPYLQRLGIDRSYEFSLASTDPQDAPHVFELATGEPPHDPLARLPETTEGWIRSQRYAQLAAYAADFDRIYAKNPDVRSELPIAIAEAWIRQLQLPPGDYRLTCRAELPRRWSLHVPEPGAEASSNAEDPMELQLIWSSWESRYQGLRRQDAGLTAAPKTSQPLAPPSGGATP